ncbi:MAG: PAS domain S-box protein [Ignavibacteriae bacterium]|nr:PAS domain S-box protein [Ignavibacteriota bacterium]
MIDSKISHNTKNDNHFRKNLSGRVAWILIVIFVLLSIIVWYLGTLYYQSQRDRIKTEKYSELSAIANLKVNEIISWRNERLNDGESISSNPLIKDEILFLLKNRNEKTKQNINKWLESILSLYDFESVIFLDKNENLIFYLPDNENGKKQIQHSYSFKKELAGKKCVLTDLHIIDTLNSKAELDLIIPIIDINVNDTIIYGSLIFEINPLKYLYPLIQSWPTESKSSETILLRKENDYIIYLNELKYKENTALKFREKLGNLNSIAGQSVKGALGIFEGLDYRGIEVLALKKDVPVFNWFLVVKVDKDEIYAGVNERTKIVTILIFAVILLQGILLIQFWRHQKLKYYKTQYKYQLEREALTKHFNYMFRYANDVILLSDVDGKIVEVNEKAFSLYGYSEDELLNMHITDLRTPETRSIYYTIFDEVNKEGGKVIEAEHVKKDSTIINIENSIRVIDIDGVKYYQSIIRDITERKESERKIIESESELRALFTSMKDVILVIDNKSRIVKIAPSNLDLLYRPADELVGKTLKESIPAKQAELFQSYFDIVFKTKKSINVEYYLPVNNKLMWFDATISPLGTEKVILVSRDVTERKVKESKIEQLTKIYKVLSNVNQAIVRFRDVNDLFAEVCKVIVDDGKFRMAWIGLINETTGDLEIKSKYGDDMEYLDHINLNLKYDDHIVGPALITLVSGENSICNDINLEYKIPNPPWRELALSKGFRSLASFPIRSVGKPEGVLVIYSTEVGNFKENEIQLFDELASDINYALEFFEKEDLIRKLSSGIKHSFISIAITDLNGTIEFVNPKFTESCGYSIEELIGKDIRILRPPDLWEDEDNKLWDVLREKGEWSGEIPVQKKSGEIYWEFAVISPIKNDKGETTHLLSVKEDITKRKQAEEELKNAIEKAEEANRLKSNFLANMSHELRTPMTGILGFAELMHNEIKDEELKEMSGMILKGGMRLTDTLNSILDLSSIEANKIDIDIQEKDIIELIKDSIRLFELSAKQKGISVKFLPDNDTPKAKIDERLFNQVMNNLLNNAIKFTEEGEIKVLCGLNETEDESYVFVKVKDTGIGILQKDIDKIFEPFRQVSEGLSRKYEGTGLGLTISKKFIELMNGKLSVESKISKGSAFTVLLPRAKGIQFSQKPKEIKEIKVVKNFLTPPNILHVEDDMLGRKVVKVLLKRECKVTDVEDGETAILLAKKEKFDLVLMDINLRGISGIETTMALRTIPGYEKTPIIAVTAYAMVGDKEEFMRNGCTHYLSKPFTKESLIKIIKEALKI